MHIYALDVQFYYVSMCIHVKSLYSLALCSAALELSGILAVGSIAGCHQEKMRRDVICLKCVVKHFDLLLSSKSQQIKNIAQIDG